MAIGLRVAVTPRCQNDIKTELKAPTTVVSSKFIGSW